MIMVSCAQQFESRAPNIVAYDYQVAKYCASVFRVILGEYEFNSREYQIARDFDYDYAHDMMPSVYHLFAQCQINDFARFSGYRCISLRALDLTMREIREHSQCARDKEFNRELHAQDRASTMFCAFKAYNRVCDCLLCPLTTRLLCNIELTAHICSPGMRHRVRCDDNTCLTLETGFAMHHHIAQMRGIARAIRDQLLASESRIQDLPQHLRAYYCALLETI